MKIDDFEQIFNRYFRLAKVYKIYSTYRFFKSKVYFLFVSVRRSNDASGKARASVNCNLILTFDGNKCSISTDDNDVTATGSGEFIVKGTERTEYKDYQWGSMNGEPVQRDILRLTYEVNLKKGKVIGWDEEKKKDIILENDITLSTNDTLVVQTRESNKKVFFSPKYVK